MTAHNRFQFGRWEKGGAITRAIAQKINEQAAENRQFARQMHQDLVFQVFDQVRKKWREPIYPRRVSMIEKLPAYTGFSQDMIRMGLDEIYQLFDPESLRGKLMNELRGIPLINGYQYRRESNTALKWQPIGTIFHVLSGNVFLVGPSSLIEGIITGNISLLKMSSQETIFLPEFIESLLEAEDELGLSGLLTRSIATFEFASHQHDVIEEFKKHVDGIVIWGGEEAVQAYRNNLPARTRAIVFGPKLSIGLVRSSGITSKGLATCADMIASELAIWDQNACTAPQVCFVEGKQVAEDLLKILPEALQRWQKKIPAGGLDTDQAAEIRKLRGIFEIAQGRSEKKLIESPERLDWTVMLDTEIAIEPSPLHRTIKIVPFEQLDQLLLHVRQLRAYIQTVGLWASAHDFLELANIFGNHGILRVVELGQMSGGGVDDPHDGAYDLPQLLNLVVHRVANSSNRLFDTLPLAERNAIIDGRLREMIAVARTKEVYRTALPNRPINGTDDLKHCKIMSRADLDPFFSHRITEECEMTGGFVTRSGGSTGIPKFSYFNKCDWEHMLANAGEIFRVCGFGPADRIANCMGAGDLYGGFISFNAVFYEIGATVFPFAGAFSADSFLGLWKDFRINALAGVSVSFMPVLRECKRRDEDFHLEKIMYAGQPMSDPDRRWLKVALGAKVISSIIGTTEANQLAYQDSSCEGLVHRLIDDYNFVEVVDGQGHSVRAGDIGDILVTTLQKTALPLIRYRIGDQGRLLVDDRGIRSIEYLGRSDDIMSIGFMNIQYRDFEKPLVELGASAVQIIGKYDEEQEFIEVNIEIESPQANFEEVALGSLNRSVGGLESSIESGKVRIRIVVYKPGSLTRNLRTGKLKAMIDERFAK
jgi:phenylacetate-coenzyme A ligase PaaK-like adenylate-forming protein